jgi:hypothetical protein
MTDRQVFLKTFAQENADERNKDTLTYRIKFIREFLNGTILQPIYSIQEKPTYDCIEIIRQLSGEHSLHYVKSGSTGHIFKGIFLYGYTDNDAFEYCIKVVPYFKSVEYNAINDKNRPENTEITMAHLLSQFVITGQTPHILLPITTFNTSINPFLSLVDDDIVNEENDQYVQFLNNYKCGLYHDQVSILISEWCNHGNLSDYLNNNYQNMDVNEWRTYFFQIIATLALIQDKYPGFRHNCLKANDILMQKTSKDDDIKFFTYTLFGKSYRVPNVGYNIKMNDFDFACIPGVVNSTKTELEWTKKINVTNRKNHYYDIHYFFNTLAFRGFFKGVVPNEVKEFVQRVVPEQYQFNSPSRLVNRRGRILNDDEYTTPIKLLDDPFFDVFRSELQHNISSSATSNKRNNTDYNNDSNKKVKMDIYSNVTSKRNNTDNNNDNGHNKKAKSDELSSEELHTSISMKNNTNNYMTQMLLGGRGRLIEFFNENYDPFLFKPTG